MDPSVLSKMVERSAHAFDRACARALAFDRQAARGRVQLSEQCRAKEKALGAKSVGASAPYCTVCALARAPPAGPMARGC